MMDALRYAIMAPNAPPEEIVPNKYAGLSDAEIAAAREIEAMERVYAERMAEELEDDSAWSGGSGNWYID